MRTRIARLQKTHKIYGPPGTGKTTTLLRRLKKYLGIGYAHTDILMIGFARATAETLKNRCIKQLGFSTEDVKSIRTIHARCWEEVAKDEHKYYLLKPENMRYFQKLINLPYKDWVKIKDFEKGDFAEDEIGSVSDIDSAKLIKHLNIIQRGRSMSKYEDSWESVLYYYNNHDELEFGNVRKNDLQHTYKCYEKFRKDNSLLDFVDMLYYGLNKAKFKNYKILIVDECQDLNPLLWKVIKKINKKVQYLILAGDDDQAIYKFNAGDVQEFLNFPCNTQVTLKISHRLPRKIKNFADRLINYIPCKGKSPRRKEKIYKAANKEGAIYSIEKVDELRNSVKADGKWIFCARTGKQNDPWKKFFINQGIVWKSKGTNLKGNDKNSINKDFLYSVNDTIVTAIDSYENLSKSGTIIGEDLFSLVKHIKGKFCNRLKEKLTDPASGLIIPKHKYTIKEIVDVEKWLKVDFSKPWFNFLHFDTKTGAFEEEDFNLYIQKCWLKDPTFRKTDIIVATIHGVKGMEAPNVVVCDVWTSLPWKSYTEKTLAHRDEEIRCAYVAITRSGQRLFIWSPVIQSRKREHRFDLLKI